MKEIETRLFGRREFVKTGALAVATALASVALGGCSSPRSQETSSSSEASTATTAANESSLQAQVVQSSGGKSLVTVFSWSGNTLQVAERIHERVESDFFRIEPAIPYTTNYDELLDVAQAEQRNGEMPAIAQAVSDWGSYDVVYLGYPIWWYEAPQIIKSFVSQYDFSGKTMVPFCTSGGSRLESTLPEVKDLCPGAVFLDGITLSGDTVSSHLGDVDAWLDGLGL